MPTLAQIYAEFPDRKVNIEIKKGGRPDIEERVAAAIAAADATARTLVVSQSRQTMQRFRQASKNQVATASSKAELIVYWLLSLVHLTRLLDPPFQALQPPDKLKGIPIVTPGFVRAAHRAGLHVHVWTVNEPATMHELLDLGVDGLMTDRPDLLREVLIDRGAWTS